MSHSERQTPIIPSKNFVLFPERSLPVVIQNGSTLQAVDAAGGEGSYVIVVAQKNSLKKSTEPNDIYKIGVLARIDKIMGSKREETLQVQLTAMHRIELADVKSEDDYLSARWTHLDDLDDCDPKIRATLVKSIKDLGRETLHLIPADTRAALKTLDAIDDLELLIAMCTDPIDLSIEERQSLLEILSVKGRALKTLEYLADYKQRLEVQIEVGKRLSSKMGKQHREAILRQQLAAIKQELGESDGGSDVRPSAKSYRTRIKELGLTEKVEQVALEEADRLESIGDQSPEAHVVRNYLDLILSLPWNAATPDAINLADARKQLNDDHYGLEKIKSRILQHLAVMKLRSDKKGSILLFVGPPGVGKTSLGESIANALDRKFVRVALGGVRDDAEIRGHRKTYVGAMPGRILQGIKRAQSKNPVFILDEIDKLGRGYGGDPAAALLEVLDPEQNPNFVDHYLDIPFDLSSVLFIATANSLEGIPAPLLDRMEVIELSGYTLAEKLHIAKKYLIPKQSREHGLSDEQVKITDSALIKLISAHTREAGVRDLQRKVQGVFRHVALQLAEKQSNTDTLSPSEIIVEQSMIQEIFGRDRFVQDLIDRVMPPGVVTGLAWTPVGGDILFIEASQMAGAGRLTLTGQLGDVMKESAQIAMSLVRTHLGPYLKFSDFEKKDYHVHVPSGAIPKDGPSAGVALLTAIASLWSGVPVRPRLAMTGEITLRGSVTAVGGIKEKVLAAHRAGVDEIILPKANERDYLEVPDEVRNQLRVHFVDHINDVLQAALGIRDVFVPLALLPADATHHVAAC
jgi:ATP-dependent Lon protease